jgi:tRNA(Arg) A34 adenosine deaminase TadA
MNDLGYLKIAFDLARESVEKGGFPAGAVLVKNDEIIAKGISLGFVLNDPTSHAESVSIREACGKLKTIKLEGVTLYSSMQPCLMCFSAAVWAGITRIVYGCNKTKDMIKKGCYEGNTDIYEINKNNNRQIQIDYLPNFEKEIISLIKSWENK